MGKECKTHFPIVCMEYQGYQKEPSLTVMTQQSSYPPSEGLLTSCGSWRMLFFTAAANEASSPNLREVVELQRDCHNERETEQVSMSF
jgi:hypothetical protein